MKHGLRAERAFEVVSPLTEGRGLKRLGAAEPSSDGRSPLTEGRGLKPPAWEAYMEDKVAPHRGAWIETCHFCSLILCWHVAPHRGAWIETCPVPT